MPPPTFDPTSLDARTTWSHLGDTPLGRRAAVSVDGCELEAELSLDARACMEPPTRVVLAFFADRLECVTLFAEDPPIPANPRWWRRQDEDARHAWHAAWLAAAGLWTGWHRWGELVAGYDSARRRASVRLRFARAGRPWNVLGTVRLSPSPRDCVDVARGLLRIEGLGIGAGTTRSGFAATVFGARAVEQPDGVLRVALGPGELFDHAASVALAFDGERLRRVDATAVSERFGARWADHGPEEAAALQAYHRAWLIDAVGGSQVDAEWGTLRVHVDGHGGSQAVRLDLAE